MSDFPYLAPPEDGLRRAMTHARRRRYRTAGFSTSGAAALVLVLGALAGGQGTQSLVEQPAPQQPAVTQVVPDSGTAGGAARPNQPSTRQAPGARGGTAPRTAAGAQQPGPALGAAAQQRAAASPARPRYVADPVERTDSTTTIPTPCSVSGSTADTTELCPWATVSGDGSKASPWQLQAEICSNRTTLTLLHYAGANEVDFAIDRVDEKGVRHEVWRWSATNPDSPSPHTLGLQAASCTDWYVTWTQVTSSGASLGPGTYELRARFLAEELRSTPAPTVTFSVS